MTTEQANKLNRIKNRQTRYELVLVNPYGRKLLFFYASGASGRRVRQVIREEFDQLARLTGCEDWRLDGPRGSTTWRGNGWTIYKSGRTQRDAILSGELPFWREPILADDPCDIPAKEPSGKTRCSRETGL